ncbi:MAG: putative short-chain dehydrogenase/reductase [Chitinophagales bacterium]|nr:MAG: putative short-chain dehydrogenase/reductase [Chitinophagales bacterium]
MQKPKVLITGASRGIGAAVALQLQREGYQVTGTSRNPDDTLKDIRFLKLDLTAPESIKSCIREAGEIDILINNAGISQMGAVEEIPPEKIRELFEINFFGAVEMMQAVLPRMRANRQGMIINIGSLAGRFALPFRASYSASKFALAGFTWALRNEVMPFGIKVTTIEPGDIRTGINPELFLHPESEYRPYLEKTSKSRSASMEQAPEPEKVARVVTFIVQRYYSKPGYPAPFYYAGKHASFLVHASRLIPDIWLEKLIRKSCGLQDHLPTH